MSSIPKLFGIVTRKSKLQGKPLIYVWNQRSPVKEYKFWGECCEWFRAGEIVQFEQTQNIDDVQEGTKVWKVTDSAALSQIDVYPTRGSDGTDEFKVKVQISVPPIGNDTFKEELDATFRYGCCALAWCLEFNQVALMDGRIDYEPGLCYVGFVSRITPENDWIVEKMGTMWVLCADIPLKELTDPIKMEQVRQRIPWKDALVRTVVNTASGNFGANISLSDPSLNLSHRPQPSLNDEWADYDVVSPQQQHQQVRKYSLQNGLSSPTQLANMTINESDEASETFLTTNNEGLDQQENKLFGTLLSRKMEWIGNQSPAAALQLQGDIMDLCHRCKSGLLFTDQNNNRIEFTPTVQQQQPMSSSTSAVRNMGHLF